MAKPRLEKVRALFYVLQHIQEDASNFDTPSSFRSGLWIQPAFSAHLRLTISRAYPRFLSKFIKTSRQFWCCGQNSVTLHFEINSTARQ